jgi:enediyne biosynthesis protein E4
LWVDEVRSGSSYNSSSDLRLHFGLGTETQLTNIQIRWPNGNMELFDPPTTVDRLIELTEGKGHPAPPAPHSP